MKLLDEVATNIPTNEKKQKKVLSTTKNPTYAFSKLRK
jgi:hypothetical protein